jgi:pilus assembly protein Flp/PilA
LTASREDWWQTIRFPFCEPNPESFDERRIPVKYIQSLAAKWQIWKDDNGQDLIEYALVVALIAFGAAAGMNTVATNINTAFANIGNKLVTYTQ